jgi:SAM-dependent methyltransferase
MKLSQPTPLASESPRQDRPTVVKDASQQALQDAMEGLYDHYFACQDYQKRYPTPNATTVDFLFAHGAGEARQILDFGCGNGRYALALLQRTQATVTGYDISLAAIDAFQGLLNNTQFGQRARLLTGPLDVLESCEKFDMVLMLFGVLSHVGGKAARQEVLLRLRALIQPNGKLVLTVPSVWRRRPLDWCSAVLSRATGRAQGVQAEPGNIEFTRVLAGAPHTFFYHLYSVQSLRRELRSCGFEVVAMDAESVLPEWLVTQHRNLGRADAAVSRFLPAALGYGIRVVARPV